MKKDERLTRMKAEVARSSVAEVARKINVPRSTLSLVVNEKYPASPKNVLFKFEAVYGGVECPHLNRRLTRAECGRYQTRQRPSGPIDLAHWRACQNCEFKG